MIMIRETYAVSATVGSNGGPDSPTWNPIRLVGVPICPDLLEWRDFGAADNLRGRVVRGFFWLLRWWPA